VRDFIDNVPDRTHFVLFYENSKRGMELKLRFLAGGIQRQRTSVFVTTRNPDEAREQLCRDGLDVDRYESGGQLLVKKIENLLADTLGFGIIFN
jgi:hypothetical protein